jgi:uncharacterized damage-inducible protein DinB
MNNTPITGILDAALSVLDTTANIIADLTDAHYTRPAPACSNATIGQHARHLVDHFAALGHAVDSDTIADYDRRQRGTDVETSRTAMLDKIAAVRAQFAGLDDVQLNAPVAIRILSAPDAAEVELESTLARELAFVTHHAIHHHALIKIAAADNGAAMHPSFGMAPSTAKASAQGG